MLATGHSRRRVAVLILLLIAATGIVVSAIAFRRPDNERRDLQSLIGAAASKAGTGGAVDLATVTDFAWDRVYWFSPYSDPDGIREALGFDWLPASPAEAALLGNLLLASDEQTLLVFVEGDRHVTGWTVLNSGSSPSYITIDPTAVSDYYAVYPHDRATFRVTDLTGQLSDPTFPGWELSPPAPD